LRVKLPGFDVPLLRPSQQDGRRWHSVQTQRRFTHLRFWNVQGKPNIPLAFSNPPSQRALLYKGGERKNFRRSFPINALNKALLIIYAFFFFKAVR